MSRGSLRAAMAIVVLAAVVGAPSLIVSGQGGARNGEWPHWGADLGNAKYSPLDQINRENVKSLRVAWRWKADNFGPRPQNNLEATPLMVGGVLYTTAGTRPSVAAIDGATGETLWTYRFDEGARGEMAPRSVSRGVEYWTDGKQQQRIILITRGYHMVSLDAKTGLPDPAFGNKGIVDLYQDFDQPTPKDGTISSTSPAVVVNNVVVVGAALQAGTAPRSKENTKGYVRGYDIRTGKRLWIFHTIPHPGEFGNDTWLNDSWAYTGNTAVWSAFSADEELGYVYLPVESPTGDFYGGHRPGNNLFAGSLVCLDAKTGKRVWHQQLVHHDIWDYDIASPPNLINITVNGKPIRAVAQVTKQSFVFVFDRLTGAPVWPIEERPVPTGDTPGEWYSPTQPVPTKPLPYDHQGVQEKDLIDFTPELNAEAREMIKQYRTGPLFTPPTVRGTDGKLGTLQLPGNQGSALWQGAAWDPETQHVVRPVGVEHDGAGASSRRHALGHGVHRWSRWRWRSGAGWSARGRSRRRSSRWRTRRRTRSAGRSDERRSSRPWSSAGRGRESGRWWGSRRRPRRWWRWSVDCSGRTTIRAWRCRQRRSWCRPRAVGSRPAGITAHQAAIRSHYGLQPEFRRHRLAGCQRRDVRLDQESSGAERCRHSQDGSGR